ncbi:MAG: endonuclease VIII, partial [Candidatus Limnocylindrales bacterium]
MPEGPEIRRAADRIAEAIEGQTVEELFFAFEALKPWQS